MGTSLYDLTVPTYLQTVRAIGGCLDLAARHCAESGGDPEDFVSARLYPDMAPFHFQIECVSNHSVCAVEALITGDFTCPPLAGAVPFAELQARIAAAETALMAFTPDQVNACEGGPALKIGPRQVGPPWLTFTPENFILSFSLPNFHFHATVAYAILRTRGVPVGKADYEAAMRVVDA